MPKIMMFFHRGWVFALLSFPLTVHAYLSCDLYNPQSVSLGDITISSNILEGTTIINKSFSSGISQCAGIVDENNLLTPGQVMLWLNPDSVVNISDHLEIGITHNGTSKTLTLTNQNIGTAYSVLAPSYYTPGGPLSFSIYIKKKGAGAIGVNEITIPTFRIFMLDSTAPFYTLGKKYMTLSGSKITVTQPTCELRAADKNRSVTLPSVRNIDFPSAGSRAGKTNFDILAFNCSTSLKTASFSFSGTQDTQNAALFANTGTAKGVAVRLSTTSDNQTIGANNINNVRSVGIASQQATLSLSAEYQSTEVAVKGGTVQSSVYFTVSYQ